MHHFPVTCEIRHALRLPSKQHTLPSKTKPTQSGHSNIQLLITQQHAANGISSIDDDDDDHDDKW